MTQPTNPAGLQGYATPSDAASRFNAIHLLVLSLLSRIATSTMVQVVACTNDGGLAPAGTVDLLPLPNQLDGGGNAIPHGVIYGCPYVRIQGGANAIIIDPQPGDIGVASFASRDLSSVIATKAQANPGSRRQFSWADGMYMGSCLGPIPQQYLQWNEEGIKIFSPTKLTFIAPEIELQGPTTITGPLTVTGPAVLEGGGSLTGAFSVNGVEMDQNHTHSIPDGNTGPVNA